MNNKDYKVDKDYDLSGKQYEVFDAAIDPLTNEAMFLYKNSQKEVLVLPLI